MMRNPKVNRVIGYIIMAISFWFFYKGAHAQVEESASMNKPLLVIAGVLFIGSIIWMLIKVRCPHCGGMLETKLFNIDICPHCGKSTDPDA